MLNTNEELQSRTTLQHLSSMNWMKTAFDRNATFVFIVTQQDELSPLFFQLMHTNYYKIFKQ
jgi:hypothetical protein